MLESSLILFIGVGFNIGAAILTDYCLGHYKAYETNPVIRWAVARSGQKGLYIVSIIECAILGYFALFVFDDLGLLGLISSIACTLLLAWDLFHDLKEYNGLRKK